MLVLLVMGLLPYAAASLGCALAMAGGEASGLWAACSNTAAVVIVLQISVIYRFYKLIDARKELAWTYPLGCAMAVLSVMISLSKLRKGASVTWRGTSYSSAGS